VKYWDASALVPLLVEQSATRAVRKLHAEDDGIITWVLSDVEARSAIARVERLGKLARPNAERARARCEELVATCNLVSAVEIVRRHAKRLLDVHDLRAADSLQLAAAVVASDHDPSALQFVALDERLRSAAKREGFAVRP
jgi:predicted nucleic acid-binding protein